MEAQRDMVWKKRNNYHDHNEVGVLKPELMIKNARAFVKKCFRDEHSREMSIKYV